MVAACLCFANPRSKTLRREGAYGGRGQENRRLCWTQGPRTTCDRNAILPTNVSRVSTRGRGVLSPDSACRRLPLPAILLHLELRKHSPSTLSLFCVSMSVTSSTQQIKITSRHDDYGQGQTRPTSNARQISIFKIQQDENYAQI